LLTDPRSDDVTVAEAGADGGVVTGGVPVVVCTGVVLVVGAEVVDEREVVRGVRHERLLQRRIGASSAHSSVVQPVRGLLPDASCAAPMPETRAMRPIAILAGVLHIAAKIGALRPALMGFASFE